MICVSLPHIPSLSLSFHQYTAIQSLNSSNGIDSININKTDNLPPINVDKSATILNKTISCGDVDLGVDLTVDGQANAQASIAVTAQGVSFAFKALTFIQLLMTN